MHSVSELITPEIAKKYYALNIDNNRPISETKISGYAADMLAKAWHETGDPIKFNTKGQLIDGQHRLLAVIQSKCTIRMHVAYDVADEAFPVIDTQKPRTFGNVLSFEQVPHSTRVAALVKWTIMWRMGYPTNKGSSVAITNSAMITAFHKDPESFIEATRRANDLRKAGVTGNIAAGMAYYLFNRISPELTHNFFDQLVTGANIAITSPVLTLRNTLLTNTGTKRYTPGEVLALFIRAWNNFVEDRAAAVLYPTGTDKRKLNNQNFPSIRTPK